MTNQIEQKPKPIHYLTRQEAAEFLRVSVRTLDKLTKQGDIAHYKFGGANAKVLFRIEDLRAYVESFRIEV